MNTENRTKNSFKNLLVGIICQILIIIMSFVSRTFFIKILGNEYLGINGLYTNVLSILSLAELGLGNVMLFSLYKPIANNDKDKIKSLISFYKKTYCLIAVIILVIGLALIPFLNIFINTTTLNNFELITYYILFLLDSVATYLFIYKTSLIDADQKNYVIKKYTTYSSLTCKTIQILLLYLTKNYYAFLICQIIFTIINNILLNLKANKMYPFLKEKKTKKLTKQDKKAIFTNIKATFVYKLSSKLLNSTDNILISIIVGTIYVGFYSNYFLIITGLNSAILILSNAIMASIGNLNAKESSDRQYKVFRTLIYIYDWIMCFCAISFFILSDDFITIWLGKKYILDNLTVFAIALNFFAAGVEIPIWLYREALGLFNKVKWIIFSSAIINIILSIIFGYKFGMLGILISTVVSKLITSAWYEPYILFKEKFNIKINKYIKQQLTLMCVTIICFVITYTITNLTNFDNIYFNLLCDGLICLLSINFIFYIFTRKTKEFNFFKQKIINKVK